MRRWYAGIALLALIACAPATFERPVAPSGGQDQLIGDFLALVPKIVDAVSPSRRPVLLDVSSFVSAGSTLVGQALPQQQVTDAVGREFRDLTGAEAVVRTSEHRFEVPGGGVHIRLETVSRVDRGYEAVVKYMYTETRATTSAIGITRVSLLFEASSDGWHLVSRQLLGTS